MTEKVLINIKGLQFNSEDEDAIEVINVGHFGEINGKMCIKYDEMLEGENKLTSNLIKISEGSVEIIKKGHLTAHLLFNANEKTMTYYETPFGSLYLGIFSKNIEIDRREDGIEIIIEYSLEVNYEEISECRVSISVKPQGSDIKDFFAFKDMQETEQE